MKIFNYKEFIKESVESSIQYIPTYEECLEICAKPDATFYESKYMISGFPISVFNYRLAQYKDFAEPLESKPNIKAYEMRGLTFVFNQDGSLYKRFLLLEKFFNLNQAPESMYSIVKDYKIKFINNKEDGSIASYIKLPNGEVIGKSKMGFDNEQSNGINRIYRTRTDVREFVDWCLSNDISAIFEYVSPANRIVLRYLSEDLILLRMRDNTTGKHLDIKNYLDKIKTIKIAPFEDDYKDLDSLIEVIAKQVDKEGVIVQTEDHNGKDLFFKLKTPWYLERHGLLTNDIYREHIIIGYILDDKIDDVLGQIPEDEKEAHVRINKIISIIRRLVDQKAADIKAAYKVFLNMGSNRKDYALKFQKTPNFSYVMSMSNGGDPYDLAKDWVRSNTRRLTIARDFLKKQDPTLFFKDPDGENQDS